MTLSSVLNTQRASGPLYLQIAMSMRREILNGDLTPGEKLSTIGQLSEKFGVSVITVRQAMAMLADEGLVRRYQGRGTYVSDKVDPPKRLTLRSDWGALLSYLEGKTPTIIKIADKVAAPMLDPALGTLEPEYRFMRRVHKHEDTPYALINIYLSQRIFNENPKAFESEMVIPLLSKLPQARTSRLQQRVFFTTADVETAKYLKLPVNSAIGDVMRVITDVDGNAIYIGQTKYRGDFVNLEFDSLESTK